MNEYNIVDDEGLTLEHIRSIPETTGYILLDDDGKRITSIRLVPGINPKPEKTSVSNEGPFILKETLLHD